MAAQEPKTPNESSHHVGLLTGVEAVRVASECAVAEMTPFLYATDPELLQAVLANPHFGEREALLLLNRRDLPPSVIEELATLHTLVNSYAVKQALMKHPKAPESTRADRYETT
ncbi:MAG: hypothetical protein EXQ58_04825 [Acidobacteria bacterium]|nr:hypothetical protein [Acidobacteriota bacterium]